MLPQGVHFPFKVLDLFAVLDVLQDLYGHLMTVLLGPEYLAKAALTKWL